MSEAEPFVMRRVLLLALASLTISVDAGLPYIWYLERDLLLRRAERFLFSVKCTARGVRGGGRAGKNKNKKQGPGGGPRAPRAVRPSP